MKPPSHLPDPLWQAITDDASDLPGLAAAEVRRQRAQRRQQRRRLAGALLVIGLGVSLWQTLRLVTPAQKDAESPPNLAANQPAGFVKVQTMEQALADPLPIPAGASQEQREVLEATRGLPMLLVMDDASHIQRIHLIER